MLLALAAAPAISNAAVAESVPGELIVGFKSGTSGAATRSIVGARDGARVQANLEGGDVVVTAAAGQSVADLAASLKRDSRVAYAEPNYIVRSLNTQANDPYFADGSTWGTTRVRSPLAWATNRGEGAVVAVLDSGTTLSHPDLMSSNWTNPAETPNNGADDDNNGFVDDYYGADWIGRDGTPNDEAGHGTHVSGTIAARHNNGIGIAGVAPGSTVMPLKFLDGNGAGNVGDAIAAIEYAVANGADVINASWGGPAYSAPLEAAIRRAGDAGVVFVAAAGNEGSNNDAAPTYPAAMNIPTLISVAATDRADNLADFSNYGRGSTQVAAPGAEILSTLGDGYGYYSGTSMAAPHVAAIVAMLRSKDQSLAAGTVANAIAAGARKVPSLSAAVSSGGVVDLIGSYAALGWDTSEFNLGTAPGAFRLKGPGKRVKIRGRSGKVKFSWTQAQDDDLVGYEVYVNGKLRAKVNKTTAKIKLRAGKKKMRWTVIAVDRAGNSRKASSGGSKGRVAVLSKKKRR